MLLDRGSPHMHMVIWCDTTVDDLLANEEIICSRMPAENSVIRKLVLKHQIHRCNIRYCMNNDPTAACRFNYPQPIVEQPYFDENDRAHYARGIEDVSVSPYCPFLLAMFETNMDIQVNKGQSALHYLAKYLAKVDDDVEFQIITDPTDGTLVNKNIMEHTKSRIVGAVEAVYDIFGYHKNHSSREVKFIPMNLPNDDNRAIRSDLKTVSADTKDIYKENIVDRYVQREKVLYEDVRGSSSRQLTRDEQEKQIYFNTINQEIESLTLPEFVSYYYQVYTNEFTICEQLRKPEYLDNKSMPLGIKSSSYLFKLKLTKQTFWRTRSVSVMADSEAYYYQQILTNVPVYGKTYDQYKAECVCPNGVSNDDVNYSWKDFYAYLVESNKINNDVPMLEQNATTDYKVSTLQGNATQQSIFNQIVHRISCNDNLHFVIGAGGTGKSFLLGKFSEYYENNNYHVVRLGPTGVSAYNIRGETIDRFMGMSNERKEINKLKLLNHIKVYKNTIFLIDEFSMISKISLEEMSTAFIKVTNRNMLFGGIPTILFGDPGQLLPINKKNGYIWESEIFRHCCTFTLWESVRQQNEKEFQIILEKIRLAKMESDVVSFLQSRIYLKRDIPDNAIRLYTSKNLVNQENEKCLQHIASELITKNSIDYPSGDIRAVNTLDHESKLVQYLQLKVGATVMITHNLDVLNGWANGTLSRIIEINEDQVKLKNLNNNNEKYITRVQDYVHETVYSRRQFPFTLAFACTIHKVQSLTLPAVALFFSNMPAHGELYVALSRVRHPEDIYIFGINKNDKDRRFSTMINWDAINIIKRK